MVRVTKEGFKETRTKQMIENDHTKKLSIFKVVATVQCLMALLMD